MVLHLIQSFCIEMNETNQTNEKIKILKKYGEANESLRKLLKYVYDSSIVFHVTSKNVKKYKQKYKENKSNLLTGEPDIFFLLNQLCQGHWTGNQALDHICQFIESYPEYESILYNILDKNLKIRISKTILQKIFPEEFPSFHVSLANNFNLKFLTDNDWFISRKLDGVRCLCVIENGKVNLFSRNRKAFHTLSLLQQEIESFVNLKDGVFDGEIIDNYEKDSFKKVMEQISRKNYRLENFEFRIFDFIPLVDFQQGSSPLIFHQRLDLLRQYINNQDLKFCKLLEQCPYTEESFSKWKETMKEKNWEGLMLRKNAIWEGKRTNNLLKYKIMHDEEFTVIDLDFGPFRVIDENTNLEKEIHCLSSVTIDYHNTKVGSGFTLEERIKFFQNPECIKNKQITVKYFEKNKQSLRFPVFKCIVN